MALDAGSVVAKLELNTKQWEQSVSRVNTDQEKLKKSAAQVGESFVASGKKMTLAGGAIVASLGAMIKTTANAGDAVSKLSQKTGISTELLSSYKLAADLADTSLEGFATGMRGLARVMNDANTGLAESQRAFDAIGVSYADADGKLRPLNDVMLDVAERFAEMPDGAQKTATAMELFGRSGMDMIPMLNLGRAGLEANRKEAERLGIVFSTQAGKQAEAFNDSLTTLQAGLKGTYQQLAVSLMPALTSFVAKATDAIAKITAWAKEHPGLAEGIGKVTLGLLALGGALAVAGPLMIGLGMLIKNLGAIKAFAANPIIITIAVALPVLSKATQDFKNEFQNMRDAWKESGASGFKATLEGITSGWNKVALGIKDSNVVLSTANALSKNFAREGGRGMADILLEEKVAADKLSPALEKVNAGIKASRTAVDTTIPPARDLNNLWARMHATIMTQTLPAARDLTGVLEGAGVAMSKLPDAAQPAVEETSNLFDGLMNDIATGFGNTIQSWLEGATTFKDFMKGMWGDIKSAFFRVVGEMVAKWVVGLVQPLVTSAAATGASITASLGAGIAAIGSGLAGLVTSLIGILPAMATAIASAATILAAAAPAILIVGAIGLGLFAAAKAIGSLIGGGGSGAGDGMGRVVERQDQQTAVLKSIIEFYRNTLGPALLVHGVNYMGKTMDAVNQAVGWLATINGTLSGMKGAYNGAGPLTEPQMIMTHGTPSRPEYVVPEPAMRAGASGGGVGVGGDSSRPIYLTVPISIGGKKIDERIIKVVANGSQTNRLRGLSERSFQGA